jgi:hypothetical protein
MTKMTKDQMISEIGRPILRPLGLIQAVFLAALISSPFLWIWAGWTLAWKVGLTGFLGILIFKGIYNIALGITTKEVEGFLNKNGGLEERLLDGSLTFPKKSRFQEKLEEMQKERKSGESSTATN